MNITEVIEKKNVFLNELRDIPGIRTAGSSLGSGIERYSYTIAVIKGICFIDVVCGFSNDHLHMSISVIVTQNRKIVHQANPRSVADIKLILEQHQ